MQILAPRERDGANARIIAPTLRRGTGAEAGMKQHHFRDRAKKRQNTGPSAAKKFTRSHRLTFREGGLFL
ncbi:hypothetical protein So717_30980 [Roseobacter cerasinus]|uniref:Uncharacterized protein n=1 Tax=Roseobacter cerasinus TaxID=2602289 RepID=A0A640VWQ1_9RHOB|nr:hypothetical protein So717_30980 [Roseobacter cerasinus]